MQMAENSSMFLNLNGFYHTDTYCTCLTKLVCQTVGYWSSRV